MLSFVAELNEKDIGDLLSRFWLKDSREKKMAKNWEEREYLSVKKEEGIIKESEREREREEKGKKKKERAF